MNIRLGRIILIALLAEFLAVLTLVLIVAVFGPPGPADAQAFAERIGYWIGPIAGFSFTLLGGWWIARDLDKSQILNGFALGVAVAAVDIAILLLMSSGFELIFVFSNLGRVVAGTIGGWLASRYPKQAV